MEVCQHFCPSCRYVPPQRVLVLHHFGLKAGEDFAHFFILVWNQIWFSRKLQDCMNILSLQFQCSAVARLDLLGGQSRVPKTQAARGFLGACSSGRF